MHIAHNVRMYTITNTKELVSRSDKETLKVSVVTRAEQQVSIIHARHCSRRSDRVGECLAANLKAPNYWCKIQQIEHDYLI